MEQLVIAIYTKTSEWMKNGYFAVFAVQVLVLGSGLITLRLAGSNFDSVQFGIFLLARRAVGLACFVFLLGLGISLPRYIGKGVAIQQQNAFICSSLILSVIMLLFCILTAIFFSQKLAGLIYGDSSYRYMIVPIVTSIVGMYCYTLSYAYFRGTLALWKASILQVFCIVFVPPVSIILNGDSVRDTVRGIGLGWILFSFPVICYMIYVSSPLKVSFFDIFANIKKLVKYGLPRVPGEFALFGLFAIPAFIVSNKSGVEQAGFLSFGLSIVQLIGSMFAVTGIILLPYISRLKYKGDLYRVKKIVNRVFFVSLVLTFVVSGIIYVFLPTIIQRFIGNSLLSGVEVFRILLIGSVPYVVYLLLRNPLDAMSVRPYNSGILSIVFILTISLILVPSLSIAPEYALVTGFLLLGTATLVVWYFEVNRSKLT